MSNINIVPVFNNHLDDFIAELIVLFPGNQDLLSSKTSVKMLRTANPKALPKLWKQHVNSQYFEHIMRGDLDYFVNCAYDEDVRQIGTTDTSSVLDMIERFKSCVRSMDDGNKQKAMGYIQNLTKLAEMV